MSALTKKLFFTLFIGLMLPSLSYGEQTLEEMLRALDTSAQIDKKIYERFPVTYNHIFSAGYFATPSARMSNTGLMGFGVAHAPPYLNWNARIQPFSHLELSANYRIFWGCKDASIGAFGFGDYADRGANFKLAIFTPEESIYALPGLSIGIDDFMGTKKFTTYYIVATQVMRDWGLEASLGWGAGCYSKGPSRGFFAGFNWFPLWNVPCTWLRGASLTAEFDPCNYKKAPHPDGRISHSPVNFGAKYVLGQYLELSASCLRGSALAVSGSLNYNWGSSFDFLPKSKDPLHYTSPIDCEPLGCTRPSTIVAQQLNYALQGQGFRLSCAWMEQNRLYLIVTNLCYRQEMVVRARLQSLLAVLTPIDIDQITVILESNGLLCQQYVYNREFLCRLRDGTMGSYEFDILSPREDVCISRTCSKVLFQRKPELWHARVAPRFESFFGSTRGKFKYDVGIKSSLEGFLPYQLFYEFQVSYTLLSTLQGISDFDFFSPSMIPNVASDYVRYRQQSAFSWDILYLQKNWNCKKSLFARAALGYFQVNYAGVAGELLWYPANQRFALGLEGAVVKKRRYAGLGFQSKLREFEGHTPIYVPYTTLQQFFFDAYLDIPELCFFTKLSIGQFLARDVGVRIDVTRYFENGVRLSGWMTFTNANDIMHGEKYFDRGIALEIPFDLFFRRSSRRVWNYAMAAWLRDAGFAIRAGKPLFETLNRERRW